MLGTELGLLTKLSGMLQACGFQIGAIEKSKFVGVMDFLLMNSPNLMLHAKYWGFANCQAGYSCVHVKLPEGLRLLVLFNALSAGPRMRPSM